MTLDQESHYILGIKTNPASKISSEGGTGLHQMRRKCVRQTDKLDLGSYLLWLHNLQNKKKTQSTMAVSSLKFHFFMT